ERRRHPSPHPRQARRAARRPLRRRLRRRGAPRAHRTRSPQPCSPTRAARSSTTASSEEIGMAKYLGIDVGSTSVRAVLVRTSYRRISIEAMNETDLAAAPTVADVIRLVAAPLVSPGESIAVNLE